MSSWWHHARCRDERQLFDATHEGHAKERHRAQEKAKKVCYDCPVRRDCFGDLLERLSDLEPNDSTVQAGYTVRDLNKMRKARRGLPDGRRTRWQ